MNVATTTVDSAPTEKTLLQKIGRMARRQPLGAVSGIMILIMVLVALLADIVAPHDPLKMNFIEYRVRFILKIINKQVRLKIHCIFFLMNSAIAFLQRAIVLATEAVPALTSAMQPS